MNYANFKDLVHAQQGRTRRKRLVLMAAESKHSLEAVVEAWRQGMITPILVGNEAKIRTCLEELAPAGERFDFEIVPVASPEESAQATVDLINSGRGDIIMKGLIDTGKMMSALLKRENGLRTGSIVSSICFVEIASYHKLLAFTDAAINTYPSLEQKKALIESSVSVMRRMGWSCPKVGVLAAVEVVNPKMPETVDAAALKEMYLRGELPGCILEGPISFDLAIDTESAKIKSFDSPVAGDADLLIFPDIAVGNIAIKILQLTGNNQSGSFIVGLKVPALLTSRGASMETKLHGLQLACAVD